MRASIEAEVSLMSTILIADDSLTYRKMMAELLRSEGFRVITANSGRDALDKIQTAHPDGVILDVVMPEMNGFEVCRQITDPQQPTHHIPVILCSSSASESSRYWGLKQGAIAYIGKPFHPSDMIRTLRHALAHAVFP